LKNDQVDVRIVCPGFCYTSLMRYSNFKWWQYILFAPIAFLNMRTAFQVSILLFFSRLVIPKKLFTNISMQSLLRTAMTYLGNVYFRGHRLLCSARQETIFQESPGISTEIAMFIDQKLRLI